MNREEINGCSSCDDFEDRRFLLSVRYRGSLRRLCVPCVLKFHAGLFCPSCFDVYDGGSPPSDSVKCIKCHSISHSQCLSSDLVSRYVCPSCADPSFLFFDTRSNGKSRGSSADRDSVVSGSDGRRVIDLMAAKAFLAAARISSASMNRAVAAARLDVERKVKEASLARKRAREALERLNSVASKEVMGEKSRTLSSVMAMEKSKRPKGSNAVARIQNNGRLGGKEKLGGYRAPILVQRPTSNNFSPVKGVNNLNGSSIQNGNVRLDENEMKLRDMSPVQNHIMGEMEI